MNQINNKTKLFISLSLFPGNTGAKLHNYGYNKFKLNAVYIPFKCKNDNQLKNILKAKNFSGVSISMPYKTSVIKYLDKVDKTAKSTNSVNTILRKGKYLIGYNTDYFALNKILNKIGKINSVLLLGNGSAGRTSFELIKKKIRRIFLSSRDLSKYKNWKIKKYHKIIAWNKRNNLEVDLILNSTPLGMKNKNHLPVNEKTVSLSKYIIDFPINLDSRLKIISKILKKKYFGGLEISLYQGIYQFRIYTGKKLSIESTKDKLNYKY